MKKLLLILPLVFLLCFTFSCEKEGDDVAEEGLSMEEVNAMTEEILNVWNNADMDAIDKVYSVDIVYSDPLSGETVGMDAFKEMIKAGQKERESFNLAIDEIFIKNDKVAAFWTVKETLLNGAEVDFSGVSIAQMVDGKLVKETLFYDTKKVLEQMGFTIIPPEEQEEK